MVLILAVSVLTFVSAGGTLTRGRCPVSTKYDDEATVLDAMHNDFIPAQSLRMTGKYHEVYLSDSVAPRRAS